MCADAVLEVVEDGAQLDRGFQVAEAAFGFEEVLVAECDVFRAQVGVAGGQQVLAVESGLGCDFGAVDLEAGLRLAQVAPECWVIAQRAFGVPDRVIVPRCDRENSPPLVRLLAR